MPSQRFNAMVTQHCVTFRDLFGQLAYRLFERRLDDDRPGTIFHPGEYGSHRELVARHFLEPFTPAHYKTGGGFAINSIGKESGQCDIIVFDSDLVPFASRMELGLFYPAEAIVCIGEVKSERTSGSEVVQSLEQLAAIAEVCYSKRSRSNLEFGILGFMICKRIGVPSVEETLVGCVRELIAIKARSFVPQLVLSVDDGLLEVDHHPEREGNLLLSFTSPGVGSTTHLKRFLCRYFSHTVNHRRRHLTIREYCQESEEDLAFTWEIPTS